MKKKNKRKRKRQVQKFVDSTCPVQSQTAYPHVRSIPRELSHFILNRQKPSLMLPPSLSTNLSTLQDPNNFSHWLLCSILSFIFPQRITLHLSTQTQNLIHCRIPILTKAIRRQRCGLRRTVRPTWRPGQGLSTR